MIARLMNWIRGRGASAPANGATRGANEVPAGSILLAGGVGFGFGVVGQANHQSSLETIYRDHATGAGCVVIASLVPERHNDYDANAIDVSICGLTVAHFSRADGKKYRNVIADVTSHGLAVCWASIRLDGADAGIGGAFQVSLDLASPKAVRTGQAG